jgi:hypothetical protein
VDVCLGEAPPACEVLQVESAGGADAGHVIPLFAQVLIAPYAAGELEYV